MKKWFQIIMRMPLEECMKLERMTRQFPMVPALLSSILLSSPIKWGSLAVTCQKYIKHMLEIHHSNVQIRECGLLYSLTIPKLVLHLMGPQQPGLLEIKCPYSVYETLAISSFFCFRLKRSHLYYHQARVQLYVCSPPYELVRFLTKDLSDQKILNVEPPMCQEQTTKSNILLLYVSCRSDVLQKVRQKDDCSRRRYATNAF